MTLSGSSWDLAALGPVKDAPYREILGNVLELMLDSCRDEQEVARLKPVPFAIVTEHSSTANDEVKLILYVGRLLAWVHGEGEGYIQRTTPKHSDGVLSRRYLRLGRHKAENATVIWLAHRCRLIEQLYVKVY